MRSQRWRTRLRCGCSAVPAWTSPVVSTNTSFSNFLKRMRASGTGGAESLLEKSPFPFARLFILLARGLHGIALGNFRDGDVPPGLISGNALVVSGFYNDDAGTGLLSAFRQRSGKLISCFGANRPGAQARRIAYKIHRQQVTVVLVAAAIPVVGAQAFVTAPATQAADAGKTVIIQQNNVELVAFLNRRDDFLRHHQIRSVADHHVHFALWIRHLDSESACNFISHTGIPIFHVIAAWFFRSPQFV